MHPDGDILAAIIGEGRSGADELSDQWHKFPEGSGRVPNGAKIWPGCVYLWRCWKKMVTRIFEKKCAS